jgi:hypothetical protein
LGRVFFGLVEDFAVFEKWWEIINALLLCMILIQFIDKFFIIYLFSFNEKIKKYLLK